jgi:hypothetical protein
LLLARHPIHRHLPAQFENLPPLPDRPQEARAVSIWAFQASLAVTPCVRLPTTVSLVQSVAAILRVLAEQRWIAVGAGADRALERVESLLTGFGCGNGQPAVVASAFGAVGITKLSARNMKTIRTGGAQSKTSRGQSQAVGVRVGK